MLDASKLTSEEKALLLWGLNELCNRNVYRLEQRGYWTKGVQDEQNLAEHLIDVIEETMK
jgi:hypothetical protein